MAVDEPPLGGEVVRVREEVLVPMVDHGSHADRSVPGDYKLGLAILAFVDELFLRSSTRRPVRDTGHHSQTLLENGPEIWALLKLDPLDVLTVETLEILHQTGIDFRLSKYPVCKDGKDGL